MVAMQKTVSKSHLKANMLKIFRELESGDEELIVTDNNNPVLRIKPLKQTESVQELFGDLQGRIVYHEEIDAPTIEEWEAA
jgi:antitoxin (DNA-binding transcriptional repressor) of toxin-antitoxin stability system